MSDAMNDKSTLEVTLVRSLISEQRSMRRWKNIRFFTWIIFFLIALLTLLLPPVMHEPREDGFGKPYISLLHLDGTIMPDKSFSAEKVIPELIAAFKDKGRKRFWSVINFAGGTPVERFFYHRKIYKPEKEMLEGGYHPEN